MRVNISKYSIALNFLLHSFYLCFTNTTLLGNKMSDRITVNAEVVHLWHFFLLESLR